MTGDGAKLDKLSNITRHLMIIIMGDCNNVALRSKIINSLWSTIFHYRKELTISEILNILEITATRIVSCS